MRLISCHIENFGRLHEFDYDFSEGCNRIACHNGWGKSTLAAFIRIMFFGFEGEKKRNGFENERKRWMPWQGGVFGGSLTFSDDVHTYTVTRIFGTKAADDRFELRDAITGLVSNAYTEQLGEEIFGVNSESFMRTVFIGQNDVATSTTDGINAKIGNVANTTMDIDGYEKTAEMLNGLLNQNSQTRVTGSIYKLNNEVAELQAEINSKHDLDNEISEIEAKITENDKALAILAEYMDTNVNGQRKVAEYKDIKSVMEVYRKISEDCNARVEESNKKREELPAEIPDEATIREYIELAGEASKIKGEAKGCLIDEDDEKYLEKLRKKYSGSDITEDKLISISRRWNEREKMLIEEANEAAAIKVDKTEATSRVDGVRVPTKAYWGIAFIVAAVAMAIITVLFSANQVITYAGLGIAGAVAVCGILFGVFVSKNHQSDMDAYFDEIFADIERKEQAYERQVEHRRKLEKEIEEFFKSLGMSFSEKTVQEDIHSIRSELDSYERLLLKQKDYYEVINRYEQVSEKIATYLKGLGIENSNDYQATLNGLLISLNSYNSAKKLAEAAVREKENFEKEKDIATLTAIDIPGNLPNIENLTEEYEQMGREVIRINNQLKDDKQKLRALRESKEILDEKRNILSEKKAKLEKAKKNYHILELTTGKLAEAKEAFTSKYMDPLLKNFNRYYSILTGEDTREYRMDANINMSVERQGTRHEIDLLSTGYRDLVGFCMRLALVDAMYKEEKPVLILDDPFVNLDSKRKKGAAALIEKLAENYQLVYFTCD